MRTLDGVLETFGGEPIPRCPGRYVLRGLGPRVAPDAVVDPETRITRHRVPGARDVVVVSWLDGWGLISYHRPDGTWLHTANDPDGFRRKLEDLAIADLGHTAGDESGVAGDRSSCDRLSR